MRRTKYITPKMILSWNPCCDYSEVRIRELFGKRRQATVQEILRSKIPPKDRLWVVLRVKLISPKILRLFACNCAERALKKERKMGREPDERSWAAVRVARRFAAGRASTDELVAARNAAGNVAGAVTGAAVTAMSAWRATRDNVEAVAQAAAWNAAEAESHWQVVMLLRMLYRTKKRKEGKP